MTGSEHVSHAGPATAQTGRGRSILRHLIQGERPYMLYAAFAVMLIVFSIASPWFLSVDNFLNIGRQTTLVSIIAVGMTFVIIARQIDLSVASTLALSGMSAALASQDPLAVGASARIVTHTLMNSGQLTAAISTARNHSLRLDHEIGERTPEFLSVYGSVLLRGAIAAAQHDERGTLAAFVVGRGGQREPRREPHQRPSDRLQMRDGVTAGGATSGSV